MKRVAFAAACLAVLALGSVGAMANAIPPQVTLSSSSIGSVVFGNNGGTLSFWFNGTAAQCGHANCVGGNALLEPQNVVGTYTMWMVGGAPTLSGNPLDYSVNMGSVTLYLEVMLGPNGSLGDLIVSETLTDLYGGTGPAPTFDGWASTSTSTMQFLADFSPTSTETIDFTVNLGKHTPISNLGNHGTTSGYVSSGELAANTPEPSSLALMGTGVLGLAGLIRRKLIK